jgi:hypothetical protein
MASGRTFWLELFLFFFLFLFIFLLVVVKLIFFLTTLRTLVLVFWAFLDILSVLFIILLLVGTQQLNGIIGGVDEFG